MNLRIKIRVSERLLVDVILHYIRWILLVLKWNSFLTPYLILFYLFELLSMLNKWEYMFNSSPLLLTCHRAFSSFIMFKFLLNIILIVNINYFLNLFWSKSNLSRSSKLTILYHIINFFKFFFFFINIG